MKRAIIHEWLVTEAGAESVLKSIYNLCPGTIYTLFHDSKALESTFWSGKDIVPSMLQKIPFAKTHHRGFLPFFPLAVEQFDLRDYNIVISSSYAVAKGVLTSSDQLHICYCHSPMRYIWDLTFQYMELAGLDHGIKGVIAKTIFHYLRNWDVISSVRVNKFVANSHYIAKRIKKCYNRDATVIYPPVDINDFSLSNTKENYFVTMARLVPYKRIDLLIKAVDSLGEKLLIIGDGPERKNLEKISSKNIEFMGYIPREEQAKILSSAKAFLYSAEEDFGIVNVEAQAAGIPVIAYGRGGALETVIDKKTGLFFYKQTTDAIIDAIKKFIKTEDSFDPQKIRENAERFPRKRFESEFKRLIDSEWEKFPYKAFYRV